MTRLSYAALGAATLVALAALLPTAPAFAAGPEACAAEPAPQPQPKPKKKSALRGLLSAAAKAGVADVIAAEADDVVTAEVAGVVAAAARDGEVGAGAALTGALARDRDGARAARIAGVVGGMARELSAAQATECAEAPQT